MLFRSDVIGLAIDYNNIADKLNVVTATIDTLNGAGALNALKATYIAMLGTANDAAMLALISTANTDIANVVVSQPALTAILNSEFGAIAGSLSSEKTYQSAAGVNYFEIQAGINSSILSFVQNLPQYGVQTEACGPADFLNQAADTSNISGQSIIGCMREGQNTVRLNASQLESDVKPSALPPVAPIPVVVPVN